MDSLPGHPVNNEDKADNIEEVLMSPNMTSLLQPLDKGVLVFIVSWTCVCACACVCVCVYTRWGV
jgi:hypothetical protein